VTAIPDTRSLETLRAVVESGSFSAAAQVLRVTPAAISKLVARLEAELGIRIFNRSTRQIGLTAEGEALYRAVARHLDGLHDAVEEARRQLVAPAGIVRASIARSFGKSFLIPQLGQFLEENPEIDLDVVFDDVPRDLIAHGFDVGIRYGVPNDSRYISRRLDTPALCVVASPAYLARRGQPAAPQDLAAHDCVTTSIGTHRTAWRFTPPGGGTEIVIRPTGRFNIADQLDGVLDGALAGLGVTVVHASAVRGHIEQGELAVLFPDYAVGSSAPGGATVHLLYPHRNYLPARVRRFIDFVAGLSTAPRDDH